MKQDLQSNKDLYDYLLRLRKKIPVHSRELFRFNIDWRLLKEVSLEE